MRRKVIQIAESTQLVSLPRKWAIQHNVKKGDELEVTEQGNKILITTEESKDQILKTEIDITGLDRDSLIFLIRGLYVRGYDEIRLIFKTPLIAHHYKSKQVKVFSVIHGEINRSTGLEIIEQKSNFCVLKNLSGNSIKEFNNVLRRTFLLIIDAVNDLIEGTKKKDYFLVETLEEKHDTITKLILYNLRMLNTIGHDNYKDTCLLFHMISSLDMIIDILKNSAREVLDMKIILSKKGETILTAIHESIKEYYDLYYHFDFKKVEKFSASRDKIIHLISKSSDEINVKEMRFLSKLEQCLEIFRNLYSFRIGIEY